jgi:hypothetical protein
MDIYKIISELHERLKQLDEAIKNLEALAAGHTTPPPAGTPKKRGRPRKNAQKPEPEKDK